jgi:hypothetical protein
MDIRKASQIADSVGGICRWDSNIRLYAIYFATGCLYFTPKELKEMSEQMFVQMVQHVNEMEAELAKEYGTPTYH